jgi:hypothetical protein
MTFATVFLLIISIQLSTYSAELITNGSFETGNFSGWTATNGTGPWYPWQVVTAGFSNGFSVPASPAHGNFVAYQGVTGNAGATFTLVQQVTIPVGTASLHWQHRYQLDHVNYCSSCGTATYAVEILNTSNILLETLYVLVTGSGIIRNTGWQQYSRSLNAYSGQTIRLRFRTNVTVTLAGPGQLEIDNVRIQAPSILIPTAARATVSGRVMTPNGQGIGRAVMELQNAATGERRQALTNAFGYFSIDDLPLGDFYALTVKHKQYDFEPATRTFQLSDNIADLTFTGTNGYTAPEK